MSCCMKRSPTLEMVSEIERKFFALNVRRDGPKTSIFVRRLAQLPFGRNAGVPDGLRATETAFV